MAIQAMATAATRASRGQVSAREATLSRVHRAASLLLTSMERLHGQTYRASPGDVLFLRQAVEAASAEIRRECVR